MDFLEQIYELFSHARWARDRLLQAVPESDGKDPPPFLRDTGSGHGSLRDEFMHIYGAEFIWFERIEGRSPTSLPDPRDCSTPIALRQLWQELDARIDAHFAEWRISTDAALNHVYTYRTTKGGQFDQALREILMHVVMHGMHHRGQISSMLKHLTGHGVSTDLIDFYREGQRKTHHPA